MRAIKSKALFRWIFGILLCLAVTGLAAAVFFQGPSRTARQETAVEDDYDMKVQGVHHEARKDGQLEWVLDADTAVYSQAGKQARLTTVRMTFYSKDGQETRITSDQGDVNTATMDFTLTGHVVIMDGVYELSSQELRYVEKQKRAWSPTPVRLIGKNLELSGNEMEYDLAEKKARVTGNVHATLGKKINDQNPFPK